MDIAQHRSLRVGTRGSPLALWQTRAVLARLRDVAPAIDAAEHVIAATGDRVLDRPLADIGGKGLFAKEIHEALAAGRIDAAVHSLKDLETALPPGIVLAAVLPREDARDALVLGPGCAAPDPADPLAALPRGARIGTSSVRRQAQLLHARPDLTVGLLRGNVQTRLARLRAGDMAATLLALAGLRRLGLEAAASVVLPPAAMLPAAGQGIVGITARAGDADLLAALRAISDRAAWVAAAAERGLLGELDGSCRTPIGAHAVPRPDGSLHLEGLVARADGSFLLRRGLTGPAAEAAALGRELGRRLRADSPGDLFA
ncbi:MAG TPA: hydroxymethylbilane synthase [Acetobacteraceae bacterium]|nr:hydroxymethylbilane synthase [Acetobacteraceae bacterium]